MLLSLQSDDIIPISAPLPTSFPGPPKLQVGPLGEIFVLDRKPVPREGMESEANESRVLRVTEEPATMVTLSSGGFLFAPRAMVIAPNGDPLVAIAYSGEDCSSLTTPCLFDSGPGAIVRIAHETSEQSILSSGEGFHPLSLGLDLEGQLYALSDSWDDCNPDSFCSLPPPSKLDRIDLVSGDRELVSDAEDLPDAEHISILALPVALPEPSQLSSFVWAALTVLILRQTKSPARERRSAIPPDRSRPGPL